MKSRFFAALLFGLSLSLAPLASADGPWIHTGQSTRVKSVGFFSVNVYTAFHYMKEKPATKSKQAIIDADVDKQFIWHMHRDVDAEKIKNALREAFKMNGYGDSGKIERFVGAFTTGDVVEWKHKDGVPDPPASCTIVYSAAKKVVTITVPGHGSATVEGIDFMKGVWSIWFGKIDQPAMGDQLINKI